jgi:hypothetical protein
MSEVVSGKNLTTIVVDEDELSALIVCLSKVNQEADDCDRLSMDLRDRLFTLFDALGIQRGGV